MANIFTPGSSVSGPWQIEGNDCLDTSLGYINANTNYLAYNTQIVNNFLTTITPTASGQPQVATLYETTGPGVSGGPASSSDVWIQRRLNTLKQYPSNLGVILNSNQFTLPAGKWLISASAPAHRVNIHQIRLYRVNPNPGIEISGTSERSDTGYTSSLFPSFPVNYNNQTRSFLEDIININQPTTYQIEHILDTLSPRNEGRELGVANNSAWGTNSVQTIVTCTKIGFTDIS